MKKRFIICFLLFLLSISNVISLNQQDSSSIISSVNFDPNTGLPKSFSEFQKNLNTFQDKEQDASYFQKEWGIILGNTPVIGPMLFYTERFFSFFNFLWNITFGLNFSWSLAFFTHIFLWGVIIFVIYFPAFEIFKNKIFAIITGFIVASLTGAFGGITFSALLLETSLRTFFSFGIFIILLIVLLLFYQRLFASMGKSQEEELLARSKMQTIAFGEVFKGFFKRE